ncbi:phosphoglycerate dehydrogenase [Actinophytocola algeriensis]|uniref:Phosphoglycerate dehydrogenase-like enzyme n=1 Tax=Actinophytocola algeriensis TaxID=1768010 RepID=A0A7W7QEC2_9PSEU|nr:phosphoglycerate dehydrogenase [Actinophytocola algeriensis]MBB4911734.1 phosphoglycerate dehydrogenase-like enzyme [Actinophytocola algeriensis]MBE1473278.1 phosphoglycerate dehydrogenase-like enzyme [Actinophytocola algeriensis]
MNRAAGTVLVTTDYRDDEADAVLTAAGLRVRRRNGHDLVEALRGVTGAIVAHDPLTAGVLARAPALRAVVRSGVGYDAVDVDAAARLGIQVSNLPGINSNAVAEYTVGLLLAAARRLVESATGVSTGDWPRESGQELRGATLGLVGFGPAARAVAPLATAFGMTVLCATNHPAGSTVEFVDLPTLLRESDYVSLHTALTPGNHHLIDAAALALMKPTAILVNTARGALVDEEALATAVATGRLAGAALDVVATEPLPPASPLRGVDGITVYSHLAGQTAQARHATALAAAHELLAALRGEPRFPVNHPKEKQ